MSGAADRLDKARESLVVGARTMFAQFAQSEPAIAPDFLSFLARAYELKVFADYEDGPDVTMRGAVGSLDKSETFVDTIQHLLTAGGGAEAETP